MRVGVICEESGIVRDEFIRRGHDAVSCDVVPSRSPGPHLLGDCRQFSWEGFDLLICHPPCTYLCNSGVRWLTTPNGGRNQRRWCQMEEAARFFQWMLNLPCPRVAVENPIMHRYAVEIVGRRQDQIVQPYQFGHGETKATCLWLKGLPKLQPTQEVPGRDPRIHRMGPSATRSRDRSETYRGMAEAMAAQWGMG